MPPLNDKNDRLDSPALSCKLNGCFNKKPLAGAVRRHPTNG